LKRFMENYVAFVRRDPETGYEVEFPDMPECRCRGRTVEEAFHRAGRALRGYTAQLRRRGEPLPRARPSRGRLGEASRHRGIVAAACLRVLG
jgi:predicted RNase H-like HicB family nuclease